MTPEEEIAHLRGELKVVREENAEKRVKNRDLGTEVSQLKAAVAERDGRIAEFERKQGKPSELQARNDELTAQIRGMKADQAFRKVAAEKGVRPEAVGDAWRLLDLKADADEPDEAAFGAAIDGARESKAYLFAPPAEEAKPAAPPSFGGGRGKEPPQVKPPTVEQMRDPAYAMEQWRSAQAAAPQARR